MILIIRFNGYCLFNKIMGGTIMKCPFCGSEMEKGYVQANRGMAYTKKYINLIYYLLKKEKLYFT